MSTNALVRVMALTALVITPLTVSAQAQDVPQEYQQVLSALGKPGDFKDKLNTAKLVEIVGAQGEQTGAVYKFTLPRTDLKVVEMGATINARMGSNTWAAFTGTNDKAVAGDVAMLESEVRPVLKVLRKNGLDVVAIHHHNHLFDVQLHQAAGVQVQGHRRSSMTIAAAVLRDTLGGRAAPAGLAPFQWASPSATSR